LGGSESLHLSSSIPLVDSSPVGNFHESFPLGVVLAGATKERPRISNPIGPVLWLIACSTGDKYERRCCNTYNNNLFGCLKDQLIVSFGEHPSEILLEAIDEFEVFKADNI
jgi:hypothetical protein